jgi:O-antigen/teichoic acid export membrane protein
MSQARRAAVNMFSGGAGFFIPMLVNFLATPILLSRLGQEAYGLQSLVNVILGYLTVADAGMDIPIIKLLAEYTAQNRLTPRNLLLSTTFQIYAAIGLVGMFALFAAEPYLQNVFNIPAELRDESEIVLLITGIGFFANSMSTWGKAVFLGIQRLEIANGIFIFFNIVSTIAGIVFVYMGLGIVFFVGARVAGFFLSALTYIIAGTKTIHQFSFVPGINRDVFKAIRPLIGYGFLMRLCGMVFARLDQALISAWIGIRLLGVYAIPTMISVAVTGLIGGIMSFTFPRASELFSLQKTDELTQFYIRSVKHTAILATYLFIFLIVAGDKFLSLWLGADLAAEAKWPLVILCSAYCITTMLATVINNVVVAVGGIRMVASYGVFRGLSMALGFVLLIKPFGITGAASGVLVGCICDFVYVALAHKHYISVPAIQIFKRSYMKPLMLGIICGALLYTSRPFITGWMSFVAAGFLYSLLFVVIAFVIRVPDEREKDALMKMVRKIKTTLGLN